LAFVCSPNPSYHSEFDYQQDIGLRPSAGDGIGIQASHHVLVDHLDISSDQDHASMSISFFKEGLS